MVNNLRETLKRASLREKKIGRTPSGYCKNDELLKFWESLGFRLPALYSKMLKKDLASLRKLHNGTLYNDNDLFEKFWNKKFNDEEIMMTMQRFHFVVFDSTYLPENKGQMSKIYLSNFLYFPWGKSKMMQSMFLHCYENPPEKKIVDDNPNLSSKLINLYRKKIMFNPEAEISNRDRETFIKASNKMVLFLEQYEKRLRTYTKITSMTAAEWLFDAVVKNSVTESILPSYFCSDKTFLVRLPQHLKKIGILNQC